MNDKKIKSLNKKWQNTFENTTRDYSREELTTERYFRFAKLIDAWKRAFYVLLFIAVGLGISTIYLLNTAKVYPYVVRINENTGEFTTEILKNEKVNVNQKELEYFLNKFIINTRTVTLDPKVFDKTLKEASTFLTKETSAKLSSFLSQENVKSYFDIKKTREVEILSFSSVPQTKNTYQIRWREKEYDQKGLMTKRKNMLAVMKIDYFVPGIEQINFNPFGIVITDFNITQEN